MSATVIGQQGMVLRAQNRRYSPGTGWQTVFVYETGIASEANSFAGSQAAPGTNTVDVDLVGPPYRVEVSTPDAASGNENDSVEDQWEVPEIDVTKSIFELDSFRALSTVEKTALQNLAGDTGQEFAPILAQLNSSNAVSFSQLILAGTTEIQSPTAALRWTRIVNRNYSAVTAAFNSVNRIFSINTITNLAGMPANIATAVAAAQSNLPTASTEYATGWLKKQPSITYRGIGRVEITQTWTLENWSTFLYGPLV